MEPLETTPLAVNETLASDRPLLLIDCREPEERAICAIRGSEHIPMAALPDSLEAIRAHPARRLVVYCHHGIRSLHAARWLRQQGIEHAQSMAGGIESWATEIDPGMPRY